MKQKGFYIIMVAVLTFVLAACGTQKVIVNPDVTGHAVVEDDAPPTGKWIKCRVCDGKGRCQNCKGTGKTSGSKCVSCNGTGRCSVCDGEGGHREQSSN